MHRWELNQDCVIGTVALQELYSALKEHKSCVAAPIQAEGKGANQ